MAINPRLEASGTSLHRAGSEIPMARRLEVDTRRRLARTVLRRREVVTMMGHGMTRLGYGGRRKRRAAILAFEKVTLLSWVA